MKNKRVSHKVAGLLTSLLVASVLQGCGSGDSGPRITGNLEIPGFIVTDNDVNDANATVQSNDTPSSAQLVPNPSSIGGYVNVARQGAIGKSYEAGDTSDFYRVDLKADQTLVLNIADSDGGSNTSIFQDRPDLDMALYSEEVLTNPSVAPLLISNDTTKFESIVVPEDGTYFIRVYPFAGGSNYLLSIGLTPVSELSGLASSAEGEMVPGEILLRYKEQTKGTLTTTEMAAFGLESKRQASSGVFVYKMREDSTYQSQNKAFSELDAQLQAKETRQMVKKLRARGDIEYAEPNYLRQAYAIPDDTFFPYQWHYSMMNLPEAWDITTGDSSAIVAVIDTGVLLDHPDLQGQLVAGYDFISDASRSGDGNGLDNNPDDPGDGGFFAASSFHGTHVAGTVAALTDNSEGVAGVAWGAKIMPLRVLGPGGGSDSDIADAIRFAAGLTNPSGTVPAERADVINLSLGGPIFSDTLRNAVQAAREAGVIVIAAAGNESTTAPSYPASLDGVVSVSALDLNRSITEYSNRGATIDVAAPGGDSTADLNGDGRGDGILSTAGDDSTGRIRFGYMLQQGTSMASPHVAGVVALMKSVYPGMTPDEFDVLLRSGLITTDLGVSGRDDLYGHGLLDAFSAVSEAQKLSGGETTEIPARVSVSPQSVNFGLNQSSVTIYIDKIGTGDLSLSTVASSENWLNVQAEQVNEQGFGRYQLSADRDSLSAGTYAATLVVTASDASEKNIDVLLQVSDQAFTGDAGTEYVLLVNESTGQVVSQDKVDALQGSATFSFSGMSEGQYQIIAGSDMDNDGFICDAGESCGAYPTEDQPLSVTFQGETLQGIDFITTYAYESPATQSVSGETTESKQGYALMEEGE